MAQKQLLQGLLQVPSPTPASAAAAVAAAAVAEGAGAGAGGAADTGSAGGAAKVIDALTGTLLTELSPTVKALRHPTDC